MIKVQVIAFVQSVDSKQQTIRLFDVALYVYNVGVSCVVDEDSLKYQIRKEVFMKLGGDPRKLDWNQVNEVTDKIIKLIEKRIDSRIKELEDERKNEIPNWDLTDDEKKLQDLLSEHRIEELKYVKEMLKK